jgi:hypothetical protein
MTLQEHMAKFGHVWTRIQENWLHLNDSKRYDQTAADNSENTPTSQQC